MAEDMEKRHYKRLDIDVTISLNKLANNSFDNETTDSIEVEAVNISKGGMAFITDRELNINSICDTKVILPNKDCIDCIINILRKTVEDDGRFMYGCTFVGMNQSDQFKIDVYDMISNQKN